MLLFGRVLNKVATEMDPTILLAEELLADQQYAKQNMATPRVVFDPARFGLGLSRSEQLSYMTPIAKSKELTRLHDSTK